LPLGRGCFCDQKVRTLSSEKIRRHCGEIVSPPALAGQSKVSTLIFTQQKCVIANFAVDEIGARRRERLLSGFGV